MFDLIAFVLFLKTSSKVSEDISDCDRGNDSSTGGKVETIISDLSSPEVMLELWHGAQFRCGVPGLFAGATKSCMCVDSMA